MRVFVFVCACGWGEAAQAQRLPLFTTHPESTELDVAEVAGVDGGAIGWKGEWDVSP